MGFKAYPKREQRQRRERRGWWRTESCRDPGEIKPRRQASNGNVD